MSCEVKIKQLLKAYTEWPDLITNSASLEEDLRLDALDLIAIVMHIEDYYTIELYDEIIAELFTVTDIIDVVNIALLKELRKI